VPIDRLHGPVSSRPPGRHRRQRAALDVAAELGAACYVLVVGSLPAGERDIEDARRQARDGVAALADRAREVGVPLALEPCTR